MALHRPKSNFRMILCLSKVETRAALEMVVVYRLVSHPASFPQAWRVWPLKPCRTQPCEPKSRDISGAEVPHSRLQQSPKSAKSVRYPLWRNYRASCTIMQVL